MNRTYNEPLWMQLVIVAGWMFLAMLAAVSAGFMMLGGWVWHWINEIFGDREIV